jgi:sulfite reductase (ferredoxin)
VHLGGHLGTEAALGKKVRGIRVTGADTVDYVERLLRRYLKGRNGHRSFREYVWSLSDEELARFADPREAMA